MRFLSIYKTTERHTPPSDEMTRAGKRLATEGCRRFLAVAGDGESEIRQIFGPGDGGAPCVS